MSTRIRVGRERNQKKQETLITSVPFFRTSVHLLPILCLLGALFFNLTEFGTSSVVTNDALPFLGVS